MKKNITINLFGTLYNIDEDAYQLLENYLNSMKRYFSRQEGGDEISDDIEHRVAELLWQKKQEGLDAINIDIIKEIIGKIGKAEEIDSSNEANASDSGDSANQQGTTSQAGGNTATEDNYDPSTASILEKVKHYFKGRKLYRDESDKVLGGVCSGFCKYFDFGEPWMWRLALVLLLVCKGFGILAYLVLWLIIPAARTPEDRVRMEGRPLTQDNLNEQIINESNHPQKHHSNNNAGCIITALILIFFAPLLFVFLTILGTFLGVFGGLMGGIGSLSGAIMPVLFGVGNTGGFIAGGVCIIAALIILVVLIVKAIRGTFRKMGTAVIVLLLIMMLGCFAWGGYCIGNTIDNLENTNVENLFYPIIRVSHTHSDDTSDEMTEQKEQDKKYLAETGFKIKNNNTDRCTYKGQYPDGDEEKCYMDTYSENNDIKFAAEKSEVLEPGTYVLKAIARAEGNGAFIYLRKNETKSVEMALKNIPAYGDKGGQLVMDAATESSWASVGALFPSLDRESVKDANNGNGYGWSVVTTAPITLTKKQTVHYGVTTMKGTTLMKSNCAWFSATDFVIQKVDGKSTKK